MEENKSIGEKHPLSFTTMEESCEVFSDDNKAFPEKKQKRRVKTPSQVEALEKFYNEHKYPTESMKLEIAESLGLTEKQISGWFCHRRLKDKKLMNGEAYAHGRQDRSSGVIQDRGSGLRQDSCGSTKQVDYRHCDPKEVESKRLTGEDLSAADLTYERGSHYTGNYSGTDDTSSKSSSPLQDSQNADPFAVATSRNLTQNGNAVPLDLKAIKGRSGPSGYLKVKAQVENAAITAVKRQLGRHYREDGPPLCVKFELLPPGAFEASLRDPVSQPYYVGDPILLQSSDGSRICKQPNPGTRYGGYNSKSSRNSELDETSLEMIHGSNQKPYLPNQSNPLPRRSSSHEMNEISAGETSVYDVRDNYEMRVKHGMGRRRPDAVTSHHLSPFGRKVTNKQTECWLNNHDEVSPKTSQRECFEYKHSNLTLKHGEFSDLEDRELSRKMAKEGKLYGERRAINEYCDPVAKRNKDEFPQQKYSRKASVGEIPPWTNQIKRSVLEMPSCLSEDETA